MSIQKILFIPDCHVPFEDKKAFSLMLKAGLAFKPDITVILGDFADFYAVSDHDKNPNRARNLESEIDAVNQRLDQIDGLRSKRKIYVKGNHEWRLERYLMRKAPELFNMVKVRELFHLDERGGWELIEYKDDVKIGKLYVTHDTGRAGAQANRQSQADYEHNVVIGHTHRIGYNVVGNARGIPHLGVMLGWLGDFGSVDYMHRVRARREWAHGFGVGYLETNTGAVHVQPVPLVGGRCVVSGSLVSL